MIQADNMLGKERHGSVLVVSAKGWHPGVVGLAAARLKERFSLPSFVLAEDKDGKLASGSGRSIPGVDIGTAVRGAFESGLIVKGGGHAMAAGLTVEKERLGDLRAFLEEKLGPQVAAGHDRALSIDAALTAGAATLELIELLEQAGPYGTAHPAPVFAFPAHRVLYAAPAGGDHIRCTIASSDGKKLKAIAFRAMGTELGELLLSEKQLAVHVAGRLTIDGAPLDPLPGLCLMLHKPLGVTCSHKEAGPLVYGLLPERWRRLQGRGQVQPAKQGQRVAAQPGTGDGRERNREQQDIQQALYRPTSEGHPPPHRHRSGPFVELPPQHPQHGQRKHRQPQALVPPAPEVGLWCVDALLGTLGPEHKGGQHQQRREPMQSLA